VALAGVAWSAPPAVFALSSHDRLRTIAGWLPWFGVALALMVVSGIAAQLMSKRRVMGLPAAVANWTEVLSTRLLLLGLLMYAAAAWFPTMRMAFEENATGEELFVGLILFLASDGAPLIFGALMNRFTLHREYRGRIRSCFGVVRSPDGNGVVLNDSDVHLSQLGDGRRGAQS
jgi:hypothetical protein